MNNKDIMLPGTGGGEKMRAILLAALILCPCCQSDGPLGLGVVCRRIPTVQNRGRLQRRECDAPAAWVSYWKRGTHWAEIIEISYILYQNF